MSAKIEYTGDEFADQAIRAIVSQQHPFYGDKPRQLLGFSVRCSRLVPYSQYHKEHPITQQGGYAWSVYRRGERSLGGSYLTRIMKRGEAYQISGAKMVDETRIQFGDALLFALDMAAKVNKLIGY